MERPGILRNAVFSNSVLNQPAPEDKNDPPDFRGGTFFYRDNDRPDLCEAFPTIKLRGFGKGPIYSGNFECMNLDSLLAGLDLHNGGVETQTVLNRRIAEQMADLRKEGLRK